MHEAMISTRVMSQFNTQRVDSLLCSVQATICVVYVCVYTFHFIVTLTLYKV